MNVLLLMKSFIKILKTNKSIPFYNSSHQNIKTKKNMPPREIKKTTIKYETSLQPSVQPAGQIQQAQKRNLEQERQRSREKIINQSKKQNHKEVTVDVNSRRARLEAMKRARQQKEKQQSLDDKNDEQRQLKIVVIDSKRDNIGDSNNQLQQLRVNSQAHRVENGNVKQQQQAKEREVQVRTSKRVQKEQPSSQSQSSQQQQSSPNTMRVLHKPVFLSKEDRSQLHIDQQQQKRRQQQRKRKNLRYTTKLLLEQSMRRQQQQESSDEQMDNLNDDEDETNLPDDCDQNNEELEYEMWKIRELRRIRRDRELRERNCLEKLEIQRRRLMNNQQILLENRLLGSDATIQQQQTKYNFMQKYYHMGAFYRDSSDPIFQRDYNLPTPLEMQDKSALPAVLQKRKGNFGKKGQSKYTHLTAQDTTDTNPLTRPDQSLLNSWKQKMAGYKK